MRIAFRLFFLFLPLVFNGSTVAATPAPVSAPAAAIQPAGQILLQNMTWQEVSDAVKAGKTTVIVPTGGTEQNGPAIPLGKHNFILRYTSMEIARELGNTLVAPI